MICDWQTCYPAHACMRVCASVVKNCTDKMCE